MARRLVLLFTLAACHSKTTVAASEPPSPPVEPAPTIEPTPTVEPAPPPSPARDSMDNMDDPPRTRSDLIVSFQLDPEVGDRPPTLAVVVRNNAAQAVPFVRFTDPRCFAYHHVDLQVSRAGKPVALTPCIVKSWPGESITLAAGASEEIDIPLAQLAPEWPNGAYEIAVNYDPTRLDMALGTTSVRATQWSVNLESFTITPIIKNTFRVAVRQSVTMPDGLTLEFGGNSHKSVSAGQTSPLMIGGTVTLKGGKPASFTTSLYPPKSRLFRVADGRYFELVDHAYGEWMDLRYYGKVDRPR